VNRLILAGAALFVGISGSAIAADLSRPAAPVYTKAPMATGYNWSGFYVGGTLGGAWGTFDPSTSTVFSNTGYFATTSPPAIAAVGAQSFKPSGFTGGVEAGYNWQMGATVVGVEADFQAFHLSGSATGTGVYPCCAPATFTVNSQAQTDWLFTARPRLGFANNNWLFYVTGGLALTNLKGNFTFTDTFATAAESGSVSSTKVGWTIGGGVEAGLGGGWSLKAEYLYVDFGSVSTTSTNLIAGTAWPMNPFTHSTDLKANIARVGLNYRFGSM
jgi:outer membrane immunogenic protein